jgi:hypothetical protein
MKSFFQYCDVKDKKINETTGSMIGRSAFGGTSVGGKVGDTIIDVIRYMTSCIGREPSAAKIGLKKMAGGNKDLENQLESIIKDDMSVPALGSRLQDLINDMESTQPSDNKNSASDSSMSSGDEDLSDKMV